MKIIIRSKITQKLKKNEIKEICKLKDSFWQHGLASQMKWFKKFVKEKDIHNLVFHENKIIGYTFLRNRTYFEKNEVIKRYLYFDTLLTHINFRENGIGKKLMRYNCNLIKKYKKFSILVCNNKLKYFYQKFGWRLENKRNFLIIDYGVKNNLMSYNLKKSKKKKSIFVNK